MRVGGADNIGAEGICLDYNREGRATRRLALWRDYVADSGHLFASRNQFPLAQRQATNFAAILEIRAM